MLDVPEHPAQKQAGQRRADELGDDVARDTPPREVPAQRERQRHGRVQVRAGDRAHEQDDRHHHQARGHDRRGEADLPLRVQKPPARGGQDQREGAQQLRKQPPPLLARIIEVLTVPELKQEYVVRARERRPQRRRVDLLGRCPTHSIRPLCGPARPRTVLPAHRHIVCHVPVPPSTAPKKLHNEDRKCRLVPAHRQVRVAGPVERVGEDEANEYWSTRAPAVRLSAAASHQSRVVASRAVLEMQVQNSLRRHPGGADVPRPRRWGGFRVLPTRVEFWQESPDGLHDRIRYRRGTGGWIIERLSP